MTSGLDTLLTALCVKIDDEIGDTRWLGRPPQLTDTDFWFDNHWITDSTPVECGRSRIQIEWLTRTSQDEQEAARRAPEGIEPEQYQRMLSGNRMPRRLSLRWRIGLITRR
ncbi:hypothetical protein ABT013_30710 [Streptomyces bacillaris]|uniref:hypothetical protein n=1 Tax=Streptomyces bacillaris TaxID=68179 RepID=UPI00030A7C23